MAKAAVQPAGRRLHQAEPRFAYYTRATYTWNALHLRVPEKESSEVPAGHEGGPGLITGKARVAQEHCPPADRDGGSSVG